MIIPSWDLSQSTVVGAAVLWDPEAGWEVGAPGPLVRFTDPGQRLASLYSLLGTMTELRMLGRESLK